MTATATAPRVNLIAWNSDDSLLTLPQLKRINPPEARSWRHKPVKHAELVEAIDSVAAGKGLKTSEWQYLVNGDKTQVFFGAIVTPTKKGLGADLLDYRRKGAAFAITGKSGNDGRVAIALNGGQHQTICSNLDLHSGEIILKRKHTNGLNLERELEAAIERYVGRLREFVEITDKAEQIVLTDDEAKLEIFASFERGDLAPRFFPHVARNYFAPAIAATLREQANEVELDRLIRQCDGEDPTGWTDCVGRTRRGLHASFTRAIRDLPASAKLRTTANVARLLTHDLN